MTKFTLVCDHSCDLDTHVVTHEFNAEYLPDVLMNIEQFLRGAGYIFDGVLEITNPDEYLTKPEDDELISKSHHYFDTGRNR